MGGRCGGRRGQPRRAGREVRETTPGKGRGTPGMRLAAGNRSHRCPDDDTLDGGAGDDGLSGCVFVELGKTMTFPCSLSALSGIADVGDLVLEKRQTKVFCRPAEAGWIIHA